MTVTLQKCYEFPTGRAEPIPEAIVHQLTYSKGLWVRCVKSHASPDEHVVACLSSAYLFFFPPARWLPGASIYEVAQPLRAPQQATGVRWSGAAHPFGTDGSHSLLDALMPYRLR